MPRLPGLDGMMLPQLFLNFRGDLIVQFKQGQVELMVGRPDTQLLDAAKLAAFFSVVRCDRLWTGELMMSSSIYVARQEFLWKRCALEVIRDAYDDGARMSGEANWPDEGFDFGAGVVFWE